MLNTITVVAHITAKPEWAVQIHDALLQAVKVTRLEEGCLYYVLYANMESQHQWTMLEQWRDADALAQHIAGTAFGALSTTLNGRALIEVSRLQPASSGAAVEDVYEPTFWTGNGLP